MVGLLLTAIATVVEECAASIGKFQVLNKRQSVYSLGFLSHVGALVIIALLTFLVPLDFFAGGFPDGFRFDTRSLPTFLTRIGLDILQAHASVVALVVAERSTFGFLRILTIPLLLAADILLGYSISSVQIAGIVLIIASLVLLFINHGLHRRGAWLVLFTALNAVATISLYKYNITHFNSVGAEQGLTYAVLVLYFYWLSRRAGEQPLSFIRHPLYALECLLWGVGSAVWSFAYLFAPASIITTAKRAMSVLWAVVSGNRVFHEKRLLLKLTAFAMVAVGTICLAL